MVRDKVVIGGGIKKNVGNTTSKKHLKKLLGTQKRYEQQTNVSYIENIRRVKKLFPK